MGPRHRRPSAAAPAALAFLSAVMLIAAPAATLAQTRFAVSFPAERSAAPLDGRMLLLLSTDGDTEPRFQVSDGPATQLVFGADVDGLKPARTPSSTRRRSLSRPQPGDLPAGELLRAGPAAPLRDLSPGGRAHGQAAHGPRRGPAMERRAGNLYSAPRKIRFDPRQAGVVRIVLDKAIPRSPRPGTRSTSATSGSSANG